MVVLARAITAPASAIVIGTEMRWYVRVRDNWHLWSGAPVGALGFRPGRMPISGKAAAGMGPQM